MRNAVDKTQADTDLAALPEIWQPEDPALASLFAAIPLAVGVPGVHLFWRLLAGFPDVLTAAWPSIAADLASTRLAASARRLRERAFIEEAVGLPSHKAFRGDLVRAEIDADFRAKISNFNALSQDGLARLLMIAAALRQAVEQPDKQTHPAATSRPRGIVPGAVAVPPLREGEARGKAANLLQRLRNEHGLPLLDDYYRSLGRIPDYLAAVWNAISPLADDEAYLERARELTMLAEQLAEDLPQPIAIARVLDRLDPSERDRLRVLLESFSRRILPQTLIDVTLVRALTDGPESAVMLSFDDGTTTD